MRHASLFSGIGGFDLAAQWLGWENIFQVENDKFCNKVLEKNFPNVKRYGDIKEFNGKEYTGAVDIISGGFPCQPFSQAGKRQGTEDDRYLWPEMLRIIREVKPAFVVGENVAGLLSMENGRTLEGIFFDLENEGYEIEAFIIPACGIGVWHRRTRVWVIAYSDSIRGNNRKQHKKMSISEREIPGDRQEGAKVGSKANKCSKDVSNSNIEGLQGNIKQGKGKEWENTKRHLRPDCRTREYWKTEPSVGRVANGIPNRVDRLKGLGNAIVPQVAYELFKVIDKINF